MRIASILVLTCLLSLSMRPASAQGPAVNFAGLPEASLERRVEASPTIGLAGLPQGQETHWIKGLAIGGGIGAILGGALSYELCNASDSGGSCTGAVIGTALISGALTGTIGALIGGAFPRYD